MNKFVRTIFSTLFLCVSSVYAEVELVSVSSSGEQGNDYSGISGIGSESASADGRYVAFTSEASNLVSGDTNGMRDVFVHDRNTGITERVSVTSSGGQAVVCANNPGGSSHPSISADGRYVAFQSDSCNLVPNDINGEVPDIFLHDRLTGVTELVSFSENGEQRTYGSGRPSMSADGRFITYGTNQIYLYDRMANVTVRASRSPTGKLADNTSFYPTISADGRFVAYISYATNLDANCTFSTQIFVFDRVTSVNECVSKSTGEEQGNDFSDHPSINGDGRFVAFVSDATNLVAIDLNGDAPDMFVHDRLTGVTELVSKSSSGEQGNNTGSVTNEVAISADGRFVTFENHSTNLVPGVRDRGPRIYVHDRSAGLTELVSVSTTGEAAFGAAPSISADGEFIVFKSFADNLVAGDSNGLLDVFISSNPLTKTEKDLVTVEKRINNEAREMLSDAAKLSTGTLYRQSYKVTNNSSNRIYQVQVFESGNLVCNFYALNPGQTRQRCDTFQTVLEGEQHVQVTVTANESGSGDALISTTDAYYTGLNVNGELSVTHRINNVNADSLDQAQTVGSSQATVSYKVENTGSIELYQVKTYHDPVTPINSGWAFQCLMGALKPGQIQHCKRDIILTESGLNQAMGRVQGRNAIRSATNVVNASNPTYFIVP